MTETATQQDQRINELMWADNAAGGAAATHQEAVAAAQANVRRLEEDVAHGEAVDPAELTNARTELGMRQDRQAVLDRESLTAEAAFQAALKEKRTFEASLIHKAMVVALAEADEVYEAAQKAYEQAKLAAGQLRTETIRQLVALDLPVVDKDGDEDGRLMAYTTYPATGKRVAKAFSDGMVFRINGKIINQSGLKMDRIERPAKSEGQ